MKRVTAFVGSARRNGVTRTATRLLLDGLESFGDAQAELVFLSDLDLRVCRGCKACFTRGEEHCPLKDDRDVLLGKMMASDGVVLASPNYSFQVSGLMKIFLDRLGFVFHRPCFHGKIFTSIVVQGIYGGDAVVRYLDFVGGGLGFEVVKGTCITALEPMTPQERRRMEGALAAQATRFHERLLSPAPAAPSLFQLWAFRAGRTTIRRTLREQDRDYGYYRDHGWFDSDYFYPTRLGPLKRLAGAAFDWMAERAAEPRACR
jgi:multimeric flavodoxin WrbA